MDNITRKYLHETALAFNIELSKDILDLFSIYVDELIEWNRHINLTGLSTPRKIVNDLLLDSILTTLYLPTTGRMLDVGSGAGFPGIVIKILHPGIEIHLLEPRLKKINFLKHVVRLLDLKDTVVIRGRIDRDFYNREEAEYHMISSRALSNLNQIILWCTPYLRYEGCLIGFLGSSYMEVLEKSRLAMEKHNLAIDKLFSYSLPGKRLKRAIVILKKTGL